MAKANIGGALAGGLGGFASGGPWGAAAGLLGGLFGGGGDKQENRVNLRPLSAGENTLFNGTVNGLNSMGSGAYDPEVFRTMFNPALRQQSKLFGKARGAQARRFAMTGGGPSSVMNRQMAELAGEEADSTNTLRSNTLQTATGMQNSRRASLMGMYQGINGARAIGAGSTTTGTYPGDQVNSAAGLAMNAFGNKDSWWNKSGPGRPKAGGVLV